MRVLLACPTYRLEPETVDGILRQEWPAYDVLFTLDNPYPETDRGRANVLHNYEKARSAALDGGYDAMMVIESDIIAPRDAIRKLAALESDVAYGLYVYQRGEPYPVNVLRYVVGPEPDQPLTNWPPEYRRAWDKGQVLCTGGGLGCVLIRRHVLEQIPFRNGDGGHCDFAFTRDVHKAGFRMMADMSVRCGHKARNGVILWPTRDGHDTEVGTLVGRYGVLDHDPIETRMAL